MPSQNNRFEIKWICVLVASPLALFIVYLWLVPPGTLPFSPGSSYSDAWLSHWPNANYLRESVLNHSTIPLWDPTRMLGQPFAANPLCKVWYPPQWVALLVPPTTALNLLIYCHAMLMGYGMAQFARAQNLSPLPAFFAVLGWGLNPKVVAHLGVGHLDIFYALAWTPVVLWMIAQFCTRPSARSAIRTGLAAALLSLADLRVAIYVLPIATLYGIYVVWANQVSKRSLLLPALLGILTFCGLVAVQVIPLVALSPYLTRSLITPTDAAEFSLPVGNLLGIGLVRPGDFHEWVTYFGIPLLVCATASILRKQRNVLVSGGWVIAILAGLWSLGDQGPLFMPAAQNLPFVTWLRVPSRAWIVVDLMMVVVGAYGLDELLRLGITGWGRLGATVIAVIGLLLTMSGLLPDIPIIVAISGASVLLTGLGLWLMYAAPGPDLEWSKLQGSRTLGGATLVIVLCASLVWLAGSYVEAKPVETLLSESALIREKLRSANRIYSLNFAIVGTPASASGLKMLNGVDPFQLIPGARVISEAANVPFGIYSITAPPIEDPDALPDRVLHPDTDFLAMLGVDVIIAPHQLEIEGTTEIVPGSNLVVHHPLQVTNDHVVDVDVRGLSGTSFDRCFPSELDSSTTRLTIRQIWLPGWVVKADGERVPIEPNRYGLITAKVPTGCHMISIAYQPTSDIIGMAISGLTAVVVISLTVWDLRNVQRDA